jgi:hypothetical protein
MATNWNFEVIFLDSFNVNAQRRIITSDYYQYRFTAFSSLKLKHLVLKWETRILPRTDTNSLLHTLSSAFCGTQRFITVFTKTHRWSVFWACRIYEVVYNLTLTEVCLERLRKAMKGLAIAQAVSRWLSNRRAAFAHGQVTWDLWWTVWHWGRFSPRTSVSPSNHHSTKFSILIITRG